MLRVYLYDIMCVEKLVPAVVHGDIASTGRVC